MLSKKSIIRHQAGAILFGFGLAVVPSTAIAGNVCELTPDPGLAGPTAAGNNALACGVQAAGDGDYATAIGTYAGVLADQGTAIGAGSVAIETTTSFNGIGPLEVPSDGDGTATAIGYRAYAVGLNTLAIGDAAAVGANVTFPGGLMRIEAVRYGTAVGSASFVNAFGGTAVGAVSSATAENAVSLGFSADATQFGATALGANSDALGAFATAIGVNADVSGTQAIAMGAQTDATATGAIAIGGDVDSNLLGAQAIEAGAVAIGADSMANAANSVALGSGSVADQANTVSVGTAANQRRITNVAAGTAATDAVNVSQLAGVTGNVTALQSNVTTLQTTVNTNTTAIGTLQSGLASTNAAVASIEATQAIMEGQIDTLFDLRDHDRRDMKQGVAAAMSMAQAPMPSAPGRVGYAVNGAAFRGEYAVGASLNYRLNTQNPMVIGVGASFAGNKNNGVRVGIAGEF